MVNSYSKQYKSWRKGKGGGSSKDIVGKKVGTAGMNKGRSLKNQVRSKERFLSRLTRKQSDNETQSDKAMYEKTKKLMETVKVEIDTLKHEIQGKEDIEREKRIASKYHQVKFFERKKLTRMEKQIRKKIQEAKQATDFEDINNLTSELEQICMDQLYVAFYPNDQKYVSIFGNGGVRIQDDDIKIRKQRIDIKKNILTQLKNGDISNSLLAKKSWVNCDVLKEKDFDLSLAEISVSLTSTSESTNRNHDEEDNNNSRNSNITTNSSKKRKITKETIMDKKDNANDVNSKSDSDSSSSSSSGSDAADNSSDEEEDEKVDKMSRMSTSTISTNEIKPEKKIHNDEDNDSKDGSSSSSSSSSDDSSSDSSSDDSSSDSSDSDSDDEINKQEGQDGDESEDDFLIDDIEQNDVKEVFAKASREALTYQDMPNEKRKGDKSRGWKTQKQRRGEWKGDKFQKKFI